LKKSGVTEARVTCWWKFFMVY